MKKLLNEFKEFAIKGNALNLAVGVIIGAAFQSVVSSLTNDILSPIIGLFTGNNIDSHEIAVLGVTIRYGAFITSVMNFLIMAFVVFLLVKFLNKLSAVTIRRGEPEAAAPEPRKCPFCLTVVDAAATRCPACSSWINTNENRQQRRPPRRPRPKTEGQKDGQKDGGSNDV